MDSTSYFISRIDLLQKKVDSLTSVSLLDQANFRLSQQPLLINQVDTFYNSAWLKLLFLITLIGLVLPWFINRLQTKSLKDLSEGIAKNVEGGFDLKVKELKIYNDAQIKAVTEQYAAELKAITDRFTMEVESLHNKIYRIDSSAEASMYHLQAQQAASDGAFGLCIIMEFRAVEYSLMAGSTSRALSSLAGLKESLLKIATKKQLDNQLRAFKNKFPEGIDHYLQIIKASPYYDEISETVNFIEKTIEELPLE